MEKSLRTVGTGEILSKHHGLVFILWFSDTCRKMALGSIRQKNTNSPPFFSLLPRPAPETWPVPASNFFTSNWFIAFLKDWAPLSQEEDDTQPAEHSAGVLSRTITLVEPSILHRRALQVAFQILCVIASHHQVSFRSSNCHWQHHEHPTGVEASMQSWHSKKSPQVQGEAGRTNSPVTTAQIQRSFAVHAFPECPWQGW